jgi:hypothetical protein
MLSKLVSWQDQEAEREKLVSCRKSGSLSAVEVSKEDAVDCPLSMSLSAEQARKLASKDDT